MATGDSFCQTSPDLTNVATVGFGRTARRLQTDLVSPCAQEPLAEPVDELAIGWWQIVMEAVDRLDDDPPLGEAGHGAQRVEARLHFYRYPDAQLRVVLDLLSFSGAGWRTTCATPLLSSFVS